MILNLFNLIYLIYSRTALIYGLDSGFIVEANSSEGTDGNPTTELVAMLAPALPMTEVP